MMRVLSRLPDSSMLGLVAGQNPEVSRRQGQKGIPLLLQRSGQTGDPAIVAFKGATVDKLLSHFGQT